MSTMLGERESRDDEEDGGRYEEGGRPSFEGRIDNDKIAATRDDSQLSLEEPAAKEAQSSSRKVYRSRKNRGGGFHEDGRRKARRGNSHKKRKPNRTAAARRERKKENEVKRSVEFIQATKTLRKNPADPQALWTYNNTLPEYSNHLPGVGGAKQRSEPAPKRPNALLGIAADTGAHQAHQQSLFGSAAHSRASSYNKKAV